MDNIIMFVIGFIISFIVTYLVTFIKKSKSDGSIFIIDDSNPGSYQWVLRFNTNISLDRIKNKKDIRLKVCYEKEQEDV